MEAQRRADRIRAFREELVELEHELGSLLSPPDRTRVEAYHDGLLAELRQSHDIATSAAEQQLSLGMRIASLVGTVTLCAAVVLFFYRYWGRLLTPAQIGVLTAGPLIGLGLTEFAARRERTLYFAVLAAGVSFAAFALALTAIGGIYNLPSSPVAYLALGAFALVLAGSYGIGLLLAVAVVCLTIFLVGALTMLSGASWSEFPSVPELSLLAGLLWVLGAVVRPPARPGFAETIAEVGALFAALALLVLGLERDQSLLPLSRGVVEGCYVVVGIVAAVGGIALGLRRQWTLLQNGSTGFLVLLLFAKAFDWWWTWMPRYLFVLVLGLMAVVTMVALNRFRRRTRTAP